LRCFSPGDIILIGYHRTKSGVGVGIIGFKVDKICSDRRRNLLINW
jgi:hypothetical protein